MVNDPSEAQLVAVATQDVMALPARDFLEGLQTPGQGIPSRAKNLSKA